MVNRRLYHKIIIVLLIISIFTTSCFASTTGNVIDAMKNLSSVDELYNYIKTTFGSDGSNVTNTFLNAILQTLKSELSTPQNIVWVDFATKNVMGVSGNFRDYMYRDSNTQASTYVKLRDFYDRYYTYSDGNAALLNQINTNTTNIQGSSTASNVHLAALRNELKNINWISANVSFEGWFLPNGTQITDYSHSLNYPIIKARFVAPNIQNTDLFNVSLGIEGWYQIDKASFIKDIYIQHYDSSGETVYPSVLDWHIMRGSTGVSILSRLPNNGRFEIVFETQKPYFITNNGTVSYLDVNSFDYYTVSDNNILRAILNKDNQSEIVNAINNKQLETNVDVTINNTITDNDLTLDVDLPNNATNDTSNLLNKLKQLMLTGVATNQLLNALDDVELHAWYSQSNKTVVESVNNQYVDLYD